MLTLICADDGHSGIFCPIRNFICQLLAWKKNGPLWLLKIFLTIFKRRLVLVVVFWARYGPHIQNNSVHFLSKLLVFQRARGFRSRSTAQFVDHIFYEMLIFLWKKVKCLKVFSSWDLNTQFSLSIYEEQLEKNRPAEEEASPSFGIESEKRSFLQSFEKLSRPAQIVLLRPCCNYAFKDGSWWISRGKKRLAELEIDFIMQNMLYSTET